jgi:hypothetical protein
MFSEDVTGVDASDFNPIESGSLTGSSISNVTENSGNNYTVTVTGYSGDGTLQLNLIDNDTILDSVGNPLGGIGAGNGDFDGNAYSIDMVSPTVSSITCADPTPTNAASVDFTVIFNENVTGVDTTDFTLPVSNTITGGSILNLTGSGSTYTVTVGNYSGDGTLRLDLTDNNSIIDSVENLLGGTEQHDGDIS